MNFDIAIKGSIFISRTEVKLDKEKIFNDLTLVLQTNGLSIINNIDLLEFVGLNNYNRYSAFFGVSKGYIALLHYKNELYLNYTLIVNRLCLIVIIFLFPFLLFSAFVKFMLIIPGLLVSFVIFAQMIVRIRISLRKVIKVV